MAAFTTITCGACESGLHGAGSRAGHPLERGRVTGRTVPGAAVDGESRDDSIPWRVEPPEQRWPRLSPVEFAVVLLRASGGAVLVTLSVLSALVAGSAEQLVGKLVDRRATNSTPDPRHDGGSVSVQRRVAFRAGGEE